MVARTRRRAVLVLLFLILLFAWILSWVYGRPKEDPKVVNIKTVLVEELFVREAGRLMLAEINLGILASQRGLSLEVKRLGQELFEEGAMRGEQLGRLSSEIGTRPSGRLSIRDERLLRRLSQLRGASFDCAFVAEVARRSSRASAVFYRIVTTGDDEGLRALAMEALPHFSLRMREARSLKSRLCPSGTSRV